MEQTCEPDARWINARQSKLVLSLDVAADVMLAFHDGEVLHKFCKPHMGEFDCRDDIVSLSKGRGAGETDERDTVGYSTVQ